ncbi:hypothetical protein [Paenibacillus sp. CF384]|uniref:hypothetical protein n=1 Tax=Paenibacillus sp. CF384 TaxID=1884382 RepID=UPI000899FEB7|nr:hypothetical protein [Paenibacillus sp. CF384]SDW43925.1 hypothetical protein SAMN05518855_1002109 [Paenibacillus sp. CF384]
MNRRSVGIILICIAAFLYGIWYVTAAIFGSNVTSWNSDLFDAMLDYVGNGPLVMSRFAFIAGICYLVAAEFERPLSKLMNQIKTNWREFGSNENQDNKPQL